jgi:acyl carrier protein
MADSEIEAGIRRVLAEHARLEMDVTRIDCDADLYDAGMTSRASVNVMLALEGTFDVEFPDEMLRRDVFQTISAMQKALTEISE